MNRKSLFCNHSSETLRTGSVSFLVDPAQERDTVLTSQRESWSRRRMWLVDWLAPTDDPEGKAGLQAAKRDDRDTRSRRSISWMKWASRSDGRSVTPHTGQQDGSSGDFLRPAIRSRCHVKKYLKKRKQARWRSTRHGTRFQIAGLCVLFSLAGLDESTALTMPPGGSHIVSYQHGIPR